MSGHQEQGTELSLAGLEERIRRLETRSDTVVEAIRLLAHGLEESPVAAPDERATVVAGAARRAYELLLVAESRPGEREGTGGRPE